MQRNEEGRREGRRERRREGTYCRDDELLDPARDANETAGLGGVGLVVGVDSGHVP